MKDLRAALRKFWSYTRFPRRYVRTWFYFLWMMTFGLFERSTRARIGEFSKEPPSPWLSGLRRNRKKTGPVESPELIPTLSLREALGERPDYLVFEPQAHRWNAPLLDVLILGRIVQQHQPQALFEFGTFDGRTSLNLIANASASAHLHTIDIQEQKCRFEQTPFAARITRLVGDSRTYDFSPYEGKMDLVFVDADHNYKGVRHDTGVALKLLQARGGVLIWHDYGPNCAGVTQALNEFFRNDPLFATARRFEDSTLVMLTVVR